MRHRVLLLGILGGFIIFSAFKPIYQSAAIIMAAISMLGFLCFLWVAGDYNASIYKVAFVDLVGIVCLYLAVTLKYINRSSDAAT